MNHPYAFAGPYARCYSVPDMAMDPRHVFIVHEILKAWRFKNALELGSFCGASSTAFVEAINSGSQMVATFCDTSPTASLWDVVGNCIDPARARVTKDPSYQVLEADEDFDFVLVDADHTLAGVLPELHRLIVRKPLCVMAHDTSATANGYQHAEGAELLKRAFLLHPEYRCIEDAERRDGEQTHRGLFFATTDLELHDVALEVYGRLGQS